MLSENMFYTYKNLLKVITMYKMFANIASKLNKPKIESPYLYICKLDKAIDKLQQVVFQQKSGKDLQETAGKIIQLAGQLSLTDSLTNYHAPSKDTSSRNCAVVATAYGCVVAALEGTNEFSDWLEKYHKASRVAQGKDNFKEMEYYGHLLDISIHKQFLRKDSFSSDTQIDSPKDTDSSLK